MDEDTIDMLLQSVASREMVQVPVFARMGGQAVNPTPQPVQMAFPVEDAPPVVWFTATWDDDDGLYFAQCLVGPGGTAVLPIGEYDVYVRITGSPEIPVKPAGKLVIY